jgi:hypothetical protein
VFINTGQIEDKPTNIWQQRQQQQYIFDAASYESRGRWGGEPINVWQRQHIFDAVFYNSSDLQDSIFISN